MPSRLTGFAKRLRHDSTDAERLIWSRLRAHRLAGFKFNRQAPIGPYIVDFACFEEKLVIELDGGQHGEAVERDKQRDEWLSCQGFRVLRFWNNEVLGNLEGVLTRVLEVLELSPSRRLSPSRPFSFSPSPQPAPSQALPHRGGGAITPSPSAWKGGKSVVFTPSPLMGEGRGEGGGESHGEVEGSAP